MGKFEIWKGEKKGSIYEEGSEKKTQEVIRKWEVKEKKRFKFDNLPQDESGR